MRHVGGKLIRILRYLLLIPILFLIVLFSYNFVNPPFTPQTILASFNHQVHKQRWIAIENIPNSLVFTVISGIDSNFCQHWGFDFVSTRKNVATGDNPTRSITYRTVESLFLWNSDHYLKRALATPLVILAELFWSKERILELYLNTVRVNEESFGVGTGITILFDKEVRDINHEDIALLTTVIADSEMIDTENLTLKQFDQVVSLMGQLSEFNPDEKISCLR